MQWERLAAMEITNGAFQNNSHKIDFDPVTGEIKSFAMKDNNARAVEALGTATEVLKKP